MSDAKTAETLSPLLSKVREIAAEAAGRILEIYASDFSIVEKDDKSPLTAADLASHQVICNGLKELTPELPIFTEESSSVPFSERSTWNRYWLVDPLDGTKEFIKKNGEFTVNISLIEGHEAVLGVVHVPVSGACYYAARGVGSWKLDSSGAAPRAIRTRPVDPRKMVVCGSRSHGSDQIQEFVRRLPGEVAFISKGSSLKLCMVAEGLADIYPRFGLTSEWDTAASQCVVEQAGGVVVDLGFNRMRYNTKESLLNPHFVVIGDERFGWRELMAAAK
jgi:3'(2'), 5'-bisphosphate nucleotidase